MTSDNGKVLLVRSVTRHDEKRRFRCSVYNKLSGGKINSVNWAKIVIINDAIKDFPARIVECAPRMTLTEGASLRLSCAASGRPMPSYHWFQVSPHGAQQNGAVPQPLQVTAPDQPFANY
ncbi:Down syndrome cell adhesion molecule protein Dscam2-like [Tropilaelaps mercedesae]|uniref:Down syndrome cell adhesion molecule protein Dscam2-like n=1 Tax=Tropilaelaps mercedesae TaxID=418985 RepID=A0A1V9XT59_9ACAR|nr:Down syndrome cell adhesion molecule protein Dscam2-like [Tropilaelaps mercedesae]